ncbi:hypothetical protein HDE_08105 [Halotydeus destructor]|nr:hypothetical protein HDE_08105 [Halotydeus destructor]
MDTNDKKGSLEDESQPSLVKMRHLLDIATESREAAFKFAVDKRSPTPSLDSVVKQLVDKEKQLKNKVDRMQRKLTMLESNVKEMKKKRESKLTDRRIAQEDCQNWIKVLKNQKHSAVLEIIRKHNAEKLLDEDLMNELVNLGQVDADAPDHDVEMA